MWKLWTPWTLTATDIDQAMILACSALKQAYRTRPTVDPSKILFIYLKGSYELILARMSEQRGHYMKPQMLASQFSALEELQDALTISAESKAVLPPPTLVRLAMLTRAIIGNTHTKHTSAEGDRL